MTYDAKLQHPKEKGMDTINGKLANKKRVLEEKVKWVVNMIENKTHYLM